jgi:hypothetical protein
MQSVAGKILLGKELQGQFDSLDMRTSASMEARIVLLWSSSQGYVNIADGFLRSKPVQNRAVLSSSASLLLHLFVDSVLIGEGTVESSIFAPGAGDVAEIPLPAALPGDPSAPGQASIATSFRLLSWARAVRRRAWSKESGTLRRVYCMQKF